MEENMQSIKTAFTCAAAGDADPVPGFDIYWMMVWAIVILDDSERREEERRKRNRANRPPDGPQPS
jgi:hypothetical protein